MELGREKKYKLWDKVYGSKEQFPPHHCFYLRLLLEVLPVLEAQLKGHVLPGAYTECHRTILLQKEITIANNGGALTAFSVPNPLRCFNFTNKETEVQRDLVTCPQSHRW